MLVPEAAPSEVGNGVSGSENSKRNVDVTLANKSACGVIAQPRKLASVNSEESVAKRLGYEAGSYSASMAGAAVGSFALRMESYESCVRGNVTWLLLSAPNTSKA